MPFFEIRVPDDFAGETRLDKYTASVPEGINRSRLKKGVSEISVNGKRAKLSSRIKRGDQIRVVWEEDTPCDIEPQNIPLDILYEDDQVTVVNKRQGMVTHPAAGNWEGTLVNALLYHWGCSALMPDASATEKERIQYLRPGIVHRLDKDTSGTIITAKNREAEEWLQTQFSERLVKKEYIAIVSGRPPKRNGDIRTQIIRDPRNRQRYKAVTDTTEGKYARTLYHCIACYGNYSLMRLRLKTGRTHQIRVHLKYIGCPIVGDPIYNTGKADKIFRTATLMLHACLLKIRLPGRSVYSTFTAEVPVRFKKALAVLHSTYQKEIL